MAIDRLPSGAFRARLQIAGRRYYQTFATEEDALDWETVTRALHITGTLHGPKTVAEYAGVWWSGYDTGPAATARFHEINLRLQILPVLGDRPIAKVIPHRGHAASRGERMSAPL